MRTLAHTKSIIAINLIRNAIGRVGATLIEEAVRVLHAARVSVKIDCLAVVENVVLFVKVVPRLLRQLLIEREDEVVFCEAALVLGHGA